MVDQATAEIVRRYLAMIDASGIPVTGGVVYGSYARGEQTRESDIDLLVLSPAFDRNKPDDLVNRLWRMTWRVDSRIEPIAVGVREFEENDDSPLIGVARRDGVLIRLEEIREEPAKVAEAHAKYGK